MILRTKTALVSALTIMSAAASSGVAAQDLSGDLASSDTDTLRSAIQTRYDAALAATNSEGVVSANDSRYVWASEAKVQCGVALGYLKSSTRDETSIGKCDYAYQRMTFVPAPPPPPVVQAPPTPAPRAECTAVEPTLVFFDWDSTVARGDAEQTIRTVAETADRCGWDAFRVVGHTDLSGSNAYNDELSMRRAEAIADLMVRLGIETNQITIRAEGETNPLLPTDDGVRSPQNRRVEVTVSL